MKKIIFSILVLLIINSKSFSQTWTYVGKDDKNGTYFIKKHSSSFGSTKVWVKYVSKSIEYFKRGKPLITNGHSISLYDTDCSGRMLNLRGITTYNINGTLVDSWSNKDYEQEWKDVIPDSVGEMFLDKACEIL